MGMGGWVGVRMTRSLPFAFFLFVGVLALPLRFSLCVASSVRVFWGSVTRSLEPCSPKKKQKNQIKVSGQNLSGKMSASTSIVSVVRDRRFISTKTNFGVSVLVVISQSIVSGGDVFTFMFLAVSAVQFFSTTPTRPDYMFF